MKLLRQRIASFALLTLGLFLTCPKAFSQPSLDEQGLGIVAFVGDEVITFTELERQTDVRINDLSGQHAASDLERFRARLRARELKAMIDQRLVLQLVRQQEEKDGQPYISEPQIDAVIQRRLQAQTGGPADAEVFYSYFRKAYGWDRTEVRAHLNRQMATEKYLWAHVLRFVQSHAGPDEMYYFYRDHVDEFSTPVEVKFWMFVISFSRAGVREEVAEVEAALKRGEAFLDLAKKHHDEGVANPSYQPIPWRRTFEELSGWPPALQEALRKMKKDEIMGPIETRMGLHFLRVEERVVGDMKPFEEVQDECRKRIVEDRRQRAQEQFFERLRESTPIRILLPEVPEES